MPLTLTQSLTQACQAGWRTHNSLHVDLCVFLFYNILITELSYKTLLPVVGSNEAAVLVVKVLYKLSWVIYFDFELILNTTKCRDCIKSVGWVPQSNWMSSNSFCFRNSGVETTWTKVKWRTKSLSVCRCTVEHRQHWPRSIDLIDLMHSLSGTYRTHSDVLQSTGVAAKRLTMDPRQSFPGRRQLFAFC